MAAQARIKNTFKINIKTKKVQITHKKNLHIVKTLLFLLNRLSKNNKLTQHNEALT